MPVSKVFELVDYCRRYPPPHLAIRQLTQMVAHFLGAKLPESSRPHDRSQPAQLNDAESKMVMSNRATPWSQVPAYVRKFVLERKATASA